MDYHTQQNEYENKHHSNGLEEYMDSWEDVTLNTEYKALVPRHPTAKQETEEEKMVNKVVSDEEFPALGTEPKSRQKTSSAPKSARVKGTRFVITGKTYMEERRRQHQKSSDELDKRTSAFEVLADKEGLEKKLTKTQMCKSVGKSKCHHGDKCRFAHTLDELKISTCFFGAKCRFVHTVDGKLVDKDQKKCNHKHPQESNDEFMTRTGLDRYKPVPKPMVVEPTVIELPKYNKKHEHNVKVERVAEKMKQSDAWVSKFKPKMIEPTAHKVEPVRPTPVKVSPLLQLEEVETVLRVPKDLAIQAMELAMKSGKTRIRVEIV